MMVGVNEPVDLDQLPIPDWGLHCPQCGYPLRGLPEHRCPECGTRFRMADLVRTWTRLREPRRTGRESPLPDYGLSCEACGAKLAGAREQRCPGCGRPFDLLRLRPRPAWFVIDEALAEPLPLATVEVLLAGDQIPFVRLDERRAVELYLGSRAIGARLRVPSEFFFDVLELLTRTRAEMQQARRAAPPWRCPSCGEEVPGHFEQCWNCEQPRGPTADAANDPDPSR